MMRVALLTALALLAATPAVAAPPVVAIVGGTLIDGHGAMHAATTVVMRGDRVEAVGHVPVPAGATVISATGAWVSAGLFDAASRVGLGELGEDDVVNDTLGTEASHAVQAGLRVADGFYPAATNVPVTRVAGVTTAALVPDGGLLAGQGAVVDLAGAEPALDAVVVRGSVGQFGSVSPDSAHLPGSAARARVLAALREVVALGRAPVVASLLEARLPFGMDAGDYAAVRALASGKVPLFLTAHRASDLMAAVAFSREEHLPLVLLGAEEGWMVAPHLAAAHVPVVLNPFADLPGSLATRGSRLDNATLLQRAGVRVAIGTWSVENARNLRQAAGLAVANGLPWTAAWQAVTMTPAALYGLSTRYGELAPGKVANAVVWAGDPFEPATAVKAVVIHGRPISLETRQTALTARYRHLP